MGERIDPAFERELESLQKELMPNVNKLQGQLIQSLETIEKGCIDRSKNNVDAFVDCMIKSTKKIEKEEKRFQFKLAFMQSQTFQCFQGAKDKGLGYDQCKQNAKDQVDRYLNELITSIGKP